VAVAARVGFSETAFVTAFDPTARTADLRFASALGEVPFCGHATIATAVAIAECHGAGPLSFSTAVGPITVRTAAEGSRLWATIVSVPTRSRPAAAQAVDDALAALRWGRDDLAVDLPPHVAFAGEDHLMLPLASRRTLRRLDYDFDGLADVMRHHGWTTLHATVRASPEEWHVREPFPVGGVVEDAATGAAAAAFGGYLRALGLVPAARRVTILQGDDMGRPSRLLLDLPADTDRSHVTGSAHPLDPPT
jgi:PhzF family phenazine biosynthesis protein